MAYDDSDTPASIVVMKTGQGTLDIDLNGDAQVHPVKKGAGSSTGIDIVRDRITGRPRQRPDQGAAITVVISKNAPEGAYEIQPAKVNFVPGVTGHLAAAHGRVPMVIYAPEGFAPVALPVKWYFSVPANAANAQIIFGAPTKLYDPEGKPWQDGKPLNGSIDLPANKPGLWALEPETGRRPVPVRVKNLPPFFACNDPQSYFMPPMEWQRGPSSSPPEKAATGTTGK